MTGRQQLTDLEIGDINLFPEQKECSNVAKQKQT